MSGPKLRKQCVVTPKRTVLVTCYQVPNAAHQCHRAKLVGHAFATVWDYDGGNSFLIYRQIILLTITFLLGTVGWVTQLVVSLYQRQRYVATSLLQLLKESPIFQGITAVGLVSSHPAACHALAKYICMWPFPF
jgi:hypothetical protein